MLVYININRVLIVKINRKKYFQPDLPYLKENNSRSNVNRRMGK